MRGGGKVASLALGEMDALAAARSRGDARSFAVGEGSQ